MAAKLDDGVISFTFKNNSDGKKSRVFEAMSHTNMKEICRKWELNISTGNVSTFSVTFHPAIGSELAYWALKVSHLNESGYAKIPTCYNFFSSEMLVRFVASAIPWLMGFTAEEEQFIINADASNKESVVTWTNTIVKLSEQNKAIKLFWDNMKKFSIIETKQ
jgi:hypothetical protein